VFVPYEYLHREGVSTIDMLRMSLNIEAFF